MAYFNFSQIKFERLALAIVATFLLADNVPHPRLGPSLVALGLKHISHLEQVLTQPVDAHLSPAEPTSPQGTASRP